jgi:type IV/VI secretion system ImpK/VasF family protein
MTPLELCEPLFLKVCELNRMARLGQSQDYLEVRSEIKGLFEDMSQRAGSDGKLAPQFKRLELPLIFFVDSMVASSKLKFADEWHQNRLAKEKYNELAGDDRFFDLLEETINDPSDEASDRLAVFYVCLGLGFVGACLGQPDQLKGYMSKIAPRIRHLVDVDRKSRLCPDAYKADTRILTEPPSSRMVLIGIVFVFLVVAVLVVYYAMYAKATDDLDQAIRRIQSHEKVR